MILSLAVTLVAGLFLGQAPGSADALSTRQAPADYQAMRGATSLGRRTFYNLLSKSYEEKYHQQGTYKTGGQYDQSVSYSSSKDYSPSKGDNYGYDEDSYESGKDYYASGSSTKYDDESKTKNYDAYKDKTPGHKSSHDPSSDKYSHKKSGSDGKNSGEYKVLKGDKKSKDGKKKEYYDFPKNKESDSDDEPNHMEHIPISVPKETKKNDYGNSNGNGSSEYKSSGEEKKKNDYGNGSSAYKSFGGKKGEEKSGYSDGKVNTGDESKYSVDKDPSKSDDEGYGKKEKDNYS